LRKEREKICIDDSLAYKWSDYPSKAAIVFIHGLGGNPGKTRGLPKFVPKPPNGRLGLAETVKPTDGPS
jgi:hypothetical protein